MIYSVEQQELIKSINGPVLCVACPGSGKTSSMIGRINHMLEMGIPDEQMLVTTFTDAAAKDMKKRLDGIRENRVDISTIHSFCYNVLRRHGESFSDLINTVTFVKYYIKQKTSSSSICFYHPIKKRKIHREYDYNASWVELQDKLRNDETLFNAIVLEISYIRTYGPSYDNYEPSNSNFGDYKKEIFEIANIYEKFKHLYNLIDYDDMIIMTRDIFTYDKATLQLWQNKYKYIMVDEFQDTNLIQADIFYMLQTGNICVVGDDDQSIYGFRHADSSIMLNFPNKFKNCKIIKLSTNYRSCKNIVAHASKLIDKNVIRFNKDFISFRTDDGDIKFNKYEDESKQAKAIMDKICAAVDNGMNYSDFSIVYRNNTSATAYVGLFTKYKIPYYCTGAVVDFHNGEIFNDIRMYYKISRKMYEIPNLFNVFWRPSRYLKVNLFKNANFSKEEHLKLCAEEWQKDKVIDMWHDIDELGKINDPVSFLHRMRIMKAGQQRQNYFDWLKDSYQKKHGNNSDDSVIDLEWNTILTEAKTFDSMEDWFYYADNYAELLRNNNKSNKGKGVCLSTMHSAKGLEWDTVFIINAMEGITPSKQVKDQAGIEEERRLFYVAITRAKNNLYISAPSDKDEKISSYLREAGILNFPSACVKKRTIKIS